MFLKCHLQIDYKQVKTESRHSKFNGEKSLVISVVELNLSNAFVEISLDDEAQGTSLQLTETKPNSSSRIMHVRVFELFKR